MVKDRFKKARLEAKEADAQLLKITPEKLPPFHGVPCTIKECFALIGMPQSAGLVARKNFRPTQEATAVIRLRQAGAIPLGITNLSELCMWMESHNNIYGRTNNPYNPKHIVGGSSGGEGAIIGAGGSPFGLGSDIGGSIRMPAFFNGVFGHKPTGGMVPGTGQFPTSSNQALRYLTTGPLTRRAEDLMPLLKILAGPDGKDTGCLPFKLGNPSNINIKELTVFDVEDNGKIKVSKDLREAQEKAVNELAKQGAFIKKIRIEGLKKSFDIWSSMLEAAGGPSFKSLLGQGKPINAWAHLIKFFLRRSPHTFPAIGLAFLENLPKMTPAKTKRFVEYGHTLKKEVVDLIGPEGVMFFPSYPTPAPRHKKPLFPPFNWVYTAIFNVLELPVTQVPLGLNAKGLPLGVQVVGIHGNDHTTIAVAMALEKALGGWVPPELLKEGDT